MQKCPQCGSRKTTVEELRDPMSDTVIGTRTVCAECHRVVHEHVHPQD